MGGWKDLDTEQIIAMGEFDFDPEQEAQEMISMIGDSMVGKELKDTVDGMLSDDYKERFIAERDQLEIRMRKLKALLDADDMDELDFELSCPVEILKRQYVFMREYKECLDERAEIEL